MYAIIQTGGKQYTVKKGDIIDIERLETKEGKEIAFDQILFLHDGSTSRVGHPHVNDCTVVGELLEEVRGPKVINFKYKQRKNYRRKVGHRQDYLRVKITEIKG